MVYDVKCFFTKRTCQNLQSAFVVHIYFWISCIILQISFIMQRYNDSS